jgi:hypothetical protein
MHCHNFQLSGQVQENQWPDGPPWASKAYVTTEVAQQLVDMNLELEAEF